MRPAQGGCSGEARELEQGKLEAMQSKRIDIVILVTAAITTRFGLRTAAGAVGIEGETCGAAIVEVLGSSRLTLDTDINDLYVTSARPFRANDITHQSPTVVRSAQDSPG